MINRVINRLKEAYRSDIGRYPSAEEVEKFARFTEERGLMDGETMFVPESWFYDTVLELLNPCDVVFDVGTGDLRFALLASEKVKKVYAVEINPEILGGALQVISYDLPKNVIPICADAREFPLPPDVTVITVLMINRTWDFPKEWRRAKIIYTRADGVYLLQPGKKAREVTLRV